jgi:hypothetical protein
MRYISHWTFNGEIVKKLIEKSRKLKENREANPEKYPKILYPDQSTIEGYGGYTVIEGTHEQLMNLRMFWGPLMEFEFIPIMDAGKVSESQMKVE